MKFDVIVIGGGLAGTIIAEDLQKNELECAIVSAGHSIHNMSYRAFENAGGELLMGDSVTEGKFDGDRLRCISTAKLGKDVLEADVFVLATGKFFGCGIKTDMNGVYEPVFGCDIVLPDKGSWFSEDFAKEQGFLGIGVATDAEGRVSVGGRTVGNLYASGEVKSGITGATQMGEDNIISDARTLAAKIKEVCHAGE